MLLATDAAGEGINLQRAHLMVNYDLPWNPNGLGQRSQWTASSRSSIETVTRSSGWKSGTIGGGRSEEGS